MDEAREVRRCVAEYGASEAAQPPSELRWGSGGAAPGKFSGFLGARRPGEAIWYVCSLIQIQYLNHKNYSTMLITVHCNIIQC